MSVCYSLPLSIYDTMANINVLNRPVGCDVTFISWNVKSLNYFVKRKKVLSHLEKLNVGIAYLQETHLRTLDHSRLRGGWIGQVYHSNFHSKSRGAAILINKNIPFVMSKVETDSSGRYIIVTGRLHNTPVILANVYAPHWDDSSFFSNFFPLLPNMNTHHLILGGDMNCALSPSLDRSSPRITTMSKTAHTIRLFLNTNGISDTWRFRNPTTKCYSFFSPVHGTYSRIDYFFLDKKLLPLVSKCEYQAIVISDHAPLVMTLRVPTSQTDYRPWRLNSLLLSDQTFVELISAEITSFLERNQTPGMSSSVVWESMKAYLRGQIISYSARIRKCLNEKLEKLTDDIFNLDARLAIAPSDELFKKRLTLQTEFNLLSTRQIENLINKTQSTTYAFGEKTGKILAHQLHQKTANRTIVEIKDELGVKHLDHSEINLCFKNFYSKLYTSESLRNDSLLDSFFDNLNIPTIDERVAAGLEETFTTEELTRAINSMQTGKSPGPDGFPSEFFKKFAGQLAPILRSVFDESFEAGSLPPTMRQAVISLIPKKDKNLLECGSYRPISLLNVDSKILSKTLASRLETVLPSIISDDQTGFIKKRHSFFNIRRLFNILYDPTPTDVPEVLISLDAEKAFDRVEWDYLFYTLQQFGFGPRFISWVKVLYSSPVAAVRTNNTISSYFPLNRGNRQGCPLSPLLFAVAVEPLAISLRNENRIKGILRHGSVHKVSLYADDMLLYISDPLVCVPKVLKLLKDFGRLSGYKVNIQKSEMMPVNDAAKSIALNSLSFKISTHKFKHLGIWITHDFKDLFKENFPPLILRLKQDLERWNLLPLSLGGRINTIKMNVMPKFLYLFQCIPIFLTKAFFCSIDKLISEFIWNKKNPRIRKSVLQRHRQHGGLSLPNFQFYYWSANIKVMLCWKELSSQETVPKWLQLENVSCGPTSLYALLCSKLPLVQPISKYSSNPIVMNSVKIWTQFRRSFSLNDFSISAPIVRNHNFKPSIIDGAYSIWSRKGIVSFRDLFSEDVFMSFEQLRLKFDIPHSHHFRFLQIRNFVTSAITNFPSQPPDSLLDTILKLSPYSKGVIGTIYSLLNTFDLEPLTSLKIQWEEDLGLEISDETWNEALDRIHTSSICLRHIVIQFKVMHRLHWSKVKLAKFVPDMDPSCDRCNQDQATLAHAFWFCPKLNTFWQSIFKTLSDVLGIPIEPSASIAVFGVVSQEIHLSRQEKNMIAFASLLARRLILLKWKEKFSPTFKAWVNDVMHHLTLEKIRYSTRGYRGALTFYSIWQPFLTYVERMSAADITDT